MKCDAFWKLQLQLEEHLRKSSEQESLFWTLSKVCE